VHRVWRRTEALLALNDLRIDPPLTNADASLRGEIDRQRDILLTFYESGMYAYQQTRERWQQAFSYALKKDPENPYYRWFTGRTPGDEARTSRAGSLRHAEIHQP
jgi:spermidine synthase